MAVWNPWRELRRREHIRFALEQLPDGVNGVWWPRAGRAAILIDRRLTRRRRNAVLAHELVHDERGGGASHDGMPEVWGPIVARDEAQVDREVARRLVPLDELAGLMVEAWELGVTIHPWEVGERYDVPVEVAEAAMRMCSPG